MASDLNRSIKIYIDNSDALAKASQLEATISELRNELRRLSAEGKKDSAEYVMKEREITKLEKSYGNYKNTVAETERVLRNLSGSTYKELISTKRILQRELQKEQRGTETYTAKLKAYQAVQKEIVVAQNEMNGALGANGTFMSRVANGFNKYFAVATAAIASITGISLTLRKLSQDAAAMEDVYADVMKTTGLTREEVGELNEEFKKMNTRTAREELNQLARDAGKLGLSSKKDVLDFVEAGNQINVALGEDLGEGAIRNIGKLTEVFKLSTRELETMDLKERMLAIGSAINDLGQSSTASESYLVDFAQRLGGVASQAGISIQDILGYASALDQSGQKIEMSATAFQNFIMKLMGDPAKFAKLAGLEVEKFTGLLQTDTNEAIKTVLKSLSEKGGFQQLIPVFQEMGLDGARAVGVLSSLSTNIHLVDEAQRISNVSFAEATSLTNEYNVKNENAAAQLEKRKKAFKDAAEELGRRLNPALLKSTNIITYIVKFLPGLLDFLGKYGKYVLYLATVYVSYTAGLKLNHLWNVRLKDSLKNLSIQQSINNTLINAGRIVALAYNVVMGLLTGNITRMQAAWKMLNVAMKTNPIGLIAVAATAAVAGVVKLVQWLNRTSSATKAVKEATDQFNGELASEQRQMLQLFEAYRRSNPESKTHLAIRKEIISKYGQYLQGLIDEKGNITDIGEAINAVNKGLREQIALKIKNQATDKIMTDSLNEQTRIVDKIMKKVGQQVDSKSIQSSIRETINRTVSDFSVSGSGDYAALERQLLSDIQATYGVDAYKGVFNIKELVHDLVGEVRDSGEALDEVKAKFSGMISEMTDTSSVVVTSTDDDPDLPPEDDKKQLEARLAAVENYIAREKALIQQKYIDGTINEAQYNRELEYLEQERLRKSLEVSGLSFEQQKEIELKIFEYKQAALKKIEDEEQQHAERLAKIQDDAAKARAEKNWNLLQQIARQNTENYKLEREKQLKQKAELISLGFDFANEMGSMLGGAIAGNEDLVSSSLKNLINMALDFLKVQVEMAIVGVTAQGLAQSMLNPAAMVKAAIKIALIEAAFAAVKGVVSSAINNITGTSSSYISGNEITTGKRVVNQQAGGKYDVIGAFDGRSYSDVPYIGPAVTGIVPRPTLVGEYGPELVVSAPDMVRLQRHVNYPLVVRAIQESRVSQRAAGNYSSVASPVPSPTPSIDMSVFDDLQKLLRWFKENGIRASVNYHEFERAKNEIETIRSGSRRK
jgi:TP901 family phage tail tape measure protein